mmetsp:Transcript_46440/g.46901  ORF Transcript_46440/g.46901 Transcript_46440/m.46901 type:complete len:100 (-) Transcript_46440:550-849(-)
MSLIMAVIACQFSFLPTVSTWALVSLVAVSNLSIIALDFYTKWCLFKTGTWGVDMQYIYNPIGFIAAKLPNHPLAKDPINSHLFETEAVTNTESTRLFI